MGRPFKQHFKNPGDNIVESMRDTSKEELEDELSYCYGLIKKLEEELDEIRDKHRI